jgi:hypothetical protein
MSHYQAIAAVTATIGYLLRNVSDIVGGATITYLRPNQLENNPVVSGAGINIYMYWADTDPFFRNADLPTRWADGKAAQLPQVALGLNYLLTCFGDNSKFEPQLLLGWAKSVLHGQPILTAAAIEQAISAYSYLADADLQFQLSRVKLTSTSLTLEDLSKLWSVFFQSQYLLSAAYQAAPVLITPDVSPLLPALPVQRRQIHLLPFYEPIIETITPQAAMPKAQITIAGHNFKGDRVEVAFPNASVIVQPGSPNQIVLTLPDTLWAGINSVMVVSEYNFGTPEAQDLRPVRRSNIAAFVLQPQINNIDPPLPGGTTITVTVEPAVGLSQAVVLWLTEKDPPAGAAPQVYGLYPQTRSDIDMPLKFDVQQVKPGTYLARLRVDHAESPPDSAVTVTIGAV